MQNTDLTEKNITLWNVENLLSYINIGKNFNVRGYWNWKKIFLQQ